VTAAVVLDDNDDMALGCCCKHQVLATLPSV